MVLAQTISSNLAKCTNTRIEVEYEVMEGDIDMEVRMSSSDTDNAIEDEPPYENVSDSPTEQDEMRPSSTLKGSRTKTTSEIGL